MRTRRPLCHPLADVFWRAVDSIATSLSPDTVRGYRATTRSFLRYLGANHHEICSLQLLRRDPHILGWLAHLRSRTPPIVLATHVNNVSACGIFLQSGPGTNRCPTWRICSVMTTVRDAKERYRAR